MDIDPDRSSSNAERKINGDAATYIMSKFYPFEVLMA